MMKDENKALTIVEIMIVGIILAILCVFAISQFRGAQRISDIKECKRKLTLLHKAVERFGYEQGRLPNATNFNYQNMTYYGADNSTFYCPVKHNTAPYDLDSVVHDMLWDDYINENVFNTTDPVVVERGNGHKDEHGNSMVFYSTIEGIKERF